MEHNCTNMLIIGNGFDLAHGRPTKYDDFLKFAEQIVRTKIYHGTKNEFESTMPNIHTDVKKYILSAFDTRTEYMEDGIRHNTNATIQEIYDCLNENVWHDYFCAIVREGKIRGKNWIDFESEILEIIKFFDEKFNDLYDLLPSQLKDFGSFNDKIKTFWSKLKFSKYNQSKGRTEDYRSTCFDFIEKTYQDLANLIRCLEIYLDNCVSKIPISCYSPDIEGLKINSILSFNYTTIPTDVYPSLLDIHKHQIHGSAQVDRPAKDNNMVLGVNEYWGKDKKDSRTNFNLYKKFVQRIIKETKIDYKQVLKRMLNEHKEREQIYGRLKQEAPNDNQVYIFGHSLDVTDGDILREVIQTEGVVTTIFYRNKQQQSDQIANLSKVLGQDELLKRVFSTSPTIIFERQAEMLDRVNVCV